MQRSMTFACATLAMFLAMIANPGVAVADVPVNEERGSLILYRDAGFSIPGLVVTYGGCSVSRETVGVVVAAADNRPATGCQVSLISRRAGLPPHQLCVGRSQVPATYAESSTIRVSSGSAPRCRVS